MSITLAKIPSPDLLRGFVAVGRRMSITLAAGDLFLTQSAVSRQIHGLETVLGVRLFERTHRAIRFTPEGEQLFNAADSAMQLLQDALGVLEDNLRGRPVTITASIGFVGLWLLPRLGAFQAQHPEIEVRISANNQIVDLRKDGLDIAIRYGQEAIMPAGATRLFGETIFPVAHPSLGLTRLDSPELIEQSTLLEFEGDPTAAWQWNVWLESQGWSGVKPKGILRFNLYDQLIHAAVAGQGIALGRGQIIGPMLADGRLVALPTPLPGPRSNKVYSLIQRDTLPSSQTQTLIDWICGEAQLTDSAPG
ncbi:LysR substrate-binding domain-containing protein [Ferribacterium limneticum]|uniref:LysR substrate-binding domain-containing protein n=1 Tax=Ferribacterium limneticum TaxID=76259 RepID=UPI001CFA9794|nr:LysR substrate-binding domain-containing protein [Ferribacterium limneticum]UCV20413.1 LysR family transcriptional regulator [Ferribacterium limneticum]